MGSVRDTFCIYHVIAPGQEPGAEDLPEGFAYPTMDELSEQVFHYQGRWKRVPRVRNCTPTFQPDSNFHKLLEEKRVLKIGQKLTEIKTKM